MKVDVHGPFKKRKITFGFLKQLPLQRQQTTAEAEKIEVAPVEQSRTCNVKESRQKVLYDKIYIYCLFVCFFNWLKYAKPDNFETEYFFMQNGLEDWFVSSNFIVYFRTEFEGF